MFVTKQLLCAMFELDYKGNQIKINKIEMDGTTVYRVVFSDRRTPLVVTKANRWNEGEFWTSVPEGRQKEAEEIGALIDTFFKEKS